MFNLLLTNSFFGLISDNAKYLVIIPLVALAISLLIIFFVKKDLLKKSAKVLFICYFFYLLILGILFLIFGIINEYSAEGLLDNELSIDVVYLVFLPILIAFSLILISAITIIILYKKNPDLAKKISKFIGLVLVLAVVAVLVCIYLYYSKISFDWYKYNHLGLWIGSVLLVLVAVVSAIFLDKKGNLEFDTKCLTIAGICVSLSFVLSYAKLWDPPTGGSVTLASLVPVMIFAYIYGMKKGLLVGFVYGLLQAVQEPWFVHPAQFLLDYFIAFSMVAFAGLLSNYNALKKLPQIKFILGAIIAVTLRFTSSVLAGVFAWEATFSASLLLNSVLLLDGVIVVLVGLFLFSSKSFVRQIDLLKKN